MMNKKLVQLNNDIAKITSFAQNKILCMKRYICFSIMSVLSSTAIDGLNIHMLQGYKS